MTKKQVTEDITRALNSSKTYWEEYRVINKLPAPSRRFFSDATAATLEPFKIEIDGQRVYPEEAVQVLLGAALAIQAQYVDKLRGQ